MSINQNKSYALSAVLLITHVKKKKLDIYLFFLIAES